MIPSPKAYRLIAEAVRYLPDGKARDAWRAWDEYRHPESALPPNVASVALDALMIFGRQIEVRLAGSSILTDDTKSEWSNDLGYVHALEKGLREEVTRLRQDA